MPTLREPDRTVFPRKAPRGRVKSLLINLGVFAGVSLAALLCFEIGLRLFETAPAYDKRDNEFAFYEYDETLGWRNKPGSRGTFYMPDSKSQVVINSQGRRDVEQKLTKKKGVRRVQFYGDSFTWGYGVDADERFSDVFARQLEAKVKTDYEVQNFGTTGYGTDQEYLYFRDAGLENDPDLVVFAYHNDVADVCLKEAYTYPRPFFQLSDDHLELTNVPVPQREVAWTARFEIENPSWKHRVNRTLKSSRVYDFFKRRLLAIDSVRARVIGAPPYAETLEVIDALLLDADRLAKENEARFAIVLIPDKGQVHGSANTIEIDGHFSPRGNELVGHLLFERMLEMGLIDGRG